MTLTVTFPKPGGVVTKNTCAMATDAVAAAPTAAGEETFASTATPPMVTRMPAPRTNAVPVTRTTEPPAVCTPNLTAPELTYDVGCNGVGCGCDAAVTSRATLVMAGPGYESVPAAGGDHGDAWPPTDACTRKPTPHPAADVSMRHVTLVCGAVTVQSRAVKTVHGAGAPAPGPHGLSMIAYRTQSSVLTSAPSAAPVTTNHRPLSPAPGPGATPVTLGGANDT